MSYNLRNRSLLALKDYEPDAIRFLLDLAVELKRSKAVGNELPRLKGKNIALIFEKPSTRTRCAFEVAMHDQGGYVTCLDAGSSQLGHKESLKDTARVLARFYDGIEYRGFHQSVVAELARFANVPVWNGLTDEAHPTQILADLMTMQERELHADLLIIATDVPAVYLDWGLPTQRAIGDVTPQGLAGYDFPEGSMGPKVEAARAFVLATGNRAVIGSLDQIEAMLAGRTGTQVRPGKKDATPRRLKA